MHVFRDRNETDPISEHLFDIRCVSKLGLRIHPLDAVEIANLLIHLRGSFPIDMSMPVNDRNNWIPEPLRFRSVIESETIRRRYLGLLCHPSILTHRFQDL